MPPATKGLVIAAALLAVAGSWLGCSDDVRSHVYTGRQFDEGRHCLDDLQSIDVVAGPQPETPCAPVCVASEGTEAGAGILYVSTMCPPYPIYPYDSDAGGDPRCAEALAANALNTTCETDGAVLNPPPPEAGADAGLDASLDVDAGIDAPAD